MFLDLENIWIGGYYHKSQWRWVTTGQVLPSVMGEDGYPPWLYNSSRNNSGCVLLDRHLCDHPVLVEMSCDRKRGFLCEQSQKIEDESSKEVEIRLADRNVTLYNIKKSWGAAFTFCLDHNSRLIVLNNYEDARFIMYGMADHVDEIKHVWIGGHLQNNTWLWAATGEKIPSKANSDGFPFWSKEVMSSERGCLNLDRLPYSTPLLYGLNCNTIQPFICEAGSVNTSPSKELLHSPFRRSGVNSLSTTQAQNAKKCYLQVLNGTWHNCSAVPYSQDVQCTLVCEYPLSVFGSKEVRCSLSTEDVVGYRRLRTPPQCLAEDKLISHFEGTLQKIYSSKKRPDCILFLVNGNADKFQITSEFLQAFILTVPLNQDFPAGMISYAGNEVMIPMKETDACQMQLLVQELEAEERETKDVDIAMGLKLVHSTLHKDKKQCCIIVLLWNGTDYISDYQKYRGTVERLRDEGHYIFAIGEEEGVNKQLEPFVSSNNIDLHMYIFRRQQQYQHWLDFAGKTKEQVLNPVFPMLPHAGLHSFFCLEVYMLSPIYIQG
ncbi:uncharacterized protein [Anabrus simplex]|uniref:uncharacterized protein n=1 Tax=Anabrus simplex TaxID=316456 RepID=UPI0035A3955B